MFSTQSCYYSVVSPAHTPSKIVLRPQIQLKNRQSCFQGDSTPVMGGHTKDRTLIQDLIHSWANPLISENFLLKKKTESDDNGPSNLKGQVG